MSLDLDQIATDIDTLRDELVKESAKTREVLEGISSAVDELSVYEFQRNALGSIDVLLRSLPREAERLTLHEAVFEVETNPVYAGLVPREWPGAIQSELHKIIAARIRNAEAVP